jgi:hypothetical protein
MSQQFYSIQLLNDLHNHFPEILYNPRRFQNVQDVLIYIRDVANMSPFERGQQQYNNWQNTNPPTNNRNTNIPYVTPVQPPSIGLNNNVPQITVSTIFEDNIPNTMRVNIPSNNINTNTLMNTLLGGLFGDILGNGMGNMNLNTFLNERVPVYPTNQEIETASTTFRAISRQDDICTICQDDIENDQNVRRLTHCNHSFHQDCIDVWFRGNVHCPTCRHDIREVNQQDNNSSPPPVPENYRRMNIRRPDSN